MRSLAYTAILAYIGALVAFAGWLFQYNLWCAFGKDVPWYLDILGACVLNGANVPVAIICLVARACGVEVPFFVF